MIKVKDFFKKGGYIEQVMPTFKQRTGQPDLAELIFDAACHHEHVLAEGPTGFGKSFALLVGAICHAINTKSRVVISTGNLALQNQYMAKDLPLVQQAFAKAGVRFSFAVAKGKNNYACAAKFDEEETLLGTSAMTWAKSLHPMRDTGDIDSAPSDVLRNWYEIGADSDCERRGCPFYKDGPKIGGDTDCFVFKAQRGYRSAQVVVTNHSLLIMDLQRGGRLLGDYDLVIVDEAHTLPDAARSAMAIEFTHRTLSREIAMIAKLLRRSGIHYYEHGYLDKYRKFEDDIFYSLDGHIDDGAKKFDSLPKRTRDLTQYATDHALNSLQEDYKVLSKLDATEGSREAEGLGTAVDKLGELFDNLCKVTQVNDLKKNWLGTVEGRTFENKKYAALKASPIEVAPILNTFLFKSGKTVVMASATLRVNDSFGFMRRESGAPKDGVREFVGESPFNFEKSMVVYAPLHLPSPSDKDYVTTMSKEIADIIRIRKGKTLVLFTSISSMNWMFYKVRDQVPYRCLKQGDAPKSRLSEDFQRDVASCLFATRSFFEGFDVPGEALSTVILVKCPFQVHTDPLFAARCAKIEQENKSPFKRLSLPLMLNVYRQAFGRLIRSESDTGVFAMLDSRALKSNYGSDLLDALPDGVRVVRKLEKLQNLNQ